mgnify:CR=1 FL=1
MTLCVPVGLWSKCATRVKLTNLLCVASGTNHIHSWLTASDSRGQLQGSNYSPRTVTVETYKSLRFALFLRNFGKLTTLVYIISRHFFRTGRGDLWCTPMY